VNELVVDCSALVDYAVTATPTRDLSEVRLHAPSLIDYEFLAAVRRLTNHRVLDIARAELSIQFILEIDVQRHPAHRLLPRMWSMRHTISSYDASYVALAEALDIPLLTSDASLARAAEQYCEVLGV
jgi:predicted nucleic acid-binding protein